MFFLLFILFVGIDRRTSVAKLYVKKVQSVGGGLGFN